MIKKQYSVIGVMSGTSLDGIDIIHVRISKNKAYAFTIEETETIPYTKEWRLILANLVNLCQEELASIDLKYSKFLGEVIQNFIIKNDISEFDFISSHGHTALHQPHKGLTYQIGNQQVLADYLGNKVICDFRVQDVLLGGQGAPLVPIGDRLLFSDFDYCLNLGGFANVSFENNNERIAYDICPVNIVLNYYVSKLGLDYDDKGQLASNGKICVLLLDRLNQIKYYKEEAPKSLGLEWVDKEIFPLINSFNLSIEDILRTYVEHVIVQISIRLNSENTNVLITGGGVYNEFLIQTLREVTPSNIVIPNKQLIEYKEALIFALLGVLKEENEVNCLKSVTGAKEDHSSGKILVPTNQN